MTVLDLQFELRRHGYEVPIEMFTKVWTRRTVKVIHRYCMWRSADHRKSGRPMEEPNTILPFRVRKPVKGIKIEETPTGYKVCWSLKDSNNG